MATFALTYFRMDGRIDPSDVPDQTIAAERVKHSSKMLTYTPFGMMNTGASCWWNTLLQVVLRCDAFNTSILLLEDSELKTEFARMYVKFLYGLIDGKTPDITMSYELLRIFEGTARVLGKTIDVRAQEGFANGLCVLMEMFPDYNVERTIFNRYSINIHCNSCKNVITREEKGPIFSFSPKYFPKTPAEFAACLSGYTTYMTDYKCEKCGVKGVAKRDHYLRRLREICIVLFDKSRNDYYYPDSFTMEAVAGPALVYKIAGVVVHSGVLNTITYASSGHYFAYILNGDSFYCCNDTSIVKQDRNFDICAVKSVHAVIYHLA